MQSLRSKIVLLKDRRRRRGDLRLHEKTNPDSTQVLVTKVHTPAPSPTTEPGHVNDRSPQPRTATSPPSDKSAGDTIHAELWRRALKVVEGREDWTKCCQIIQSRTGAQVSRSVDGKTSLLQIEEVTLYVQQLATSKDQERSTTFQACVDGVTKTLQCIKDVGAAATAFNPYAAFGWNILQYVVSVASTDRVVQRSACETLPEVVERLIRYQTWTEFYPEGSTTAIRTQFEDCLQDVYTGVLTYQVAVVIDLYSRMTRWKTALSATEAASRTQEALTNLEAKERKWQLLEPVVNREISNAQFKQIQDASIELKKTSQAILDKVAVLSQYTEEERRHAILEWISPVHSEEAHREVRRQSLPGTAIWLMNHSDYMSWCNDSKFTCLWLEGWAGVGKSCLVNAVIEDQIARFKASHERPQVLYFYCDGTDAEHRQQIDSHEKILRSLVRQLAALGNTQSLPTVLIDIYDRQRNTVYLNGEQCHDLLLSMSDDSVDLKIILDGIDECPPNVQWNLIRAVHQLSTKRSGRVKIVAAGRATATLQSSLELLKPAIVHVQDHNQDDIRIMVESTVAESLKNEILRPLYLINSRNLAPKVIEKLVEAARGMFRYVQIAFDRLHKSKSPHILERRLGQLDQLTGIDDLYEQNWADAMADMDSLEQEVIIASLVFLIYGFSYGIRNDISDRIAIRDSQHILEAGTFILKGNIDEPFSIRDLVALCPSFLTTSVLISTNDSLSKANPASNLRIPHLSVTEYLIRRHSKWFSPAAANALIAALCMRVFINMQTLPNFNIQPPNGLILYSVMAWPEHIRLSRSTDANQQGMDLIRPVLDDFLLGSTCSKSFLRWTTTMRSFRRYFVHQNRGPVLKPDEEVRLGVKPNVTNKVEDELLIGVSLVTQPPSSLFARIYLGFEIESMRQDCSRVRTTWSYGSETVTPHAFAATMGLEGAIEALSLRGCNPNDQNDEGDTSGHVLCAEGVIVQNRSHCSFASMLRALLRAGLNLNIKNHAGNTCLFKMLQLSHFSAEVLQIFVEQGFDLEATEPDFLSRNRQITQRPSSSPFEFLMSHCPSFPYRQDSLEAFVSHYVSKDNNQRSRTKLLCMAVNINKGDRDMVKMLLERYDADALLCDEQGLLPLQLAMVPGLDGGQINTAVIDALTPSTLKPEFYSHLKRGDGFKRPIFECMLRGCKWDTIRLFIGYIAPIVPKDCAWGPQPITHALLYNRRHGKEIAQNLESAGCTQARSSVVYRRWKEGQLPDEEIGQKYGWDLDALDEDETEACDAEDEFWDAEERLLDS